MADSITDREQMFLALRGKPVLKDFAQKVQADPGAIRLLF